MTTTGEKINVSCLTGYGAKNVACTMFKLHEFIPNLTDYKQIYIEPFFFTGADPPYRGTEKNYQVVFSNEDHLQLLEYHRALKDDPNMNIYISYNDDPVVREWYADWYIKEVEWHTANLGSDSYHELFISNHEIKRHKTVVFKTVI